MASSSDESELRLPFSTSPNPTPTFYSSPKNLHKSKKKHPQKRPEKRHPSPLPPDDEWLWRRGGEVMLEGYVDPVDGSGDGGSEGGDGAVGRTKSLTDEDLEELKGCVDLGFGFSYDEIPELCSTLPALELCYSMSQRFFDEHGSDCLPASSGPIANWKISSPGDHPDEVKARLKYWAQAVACTVRLCN